MAGGTTGDPTTPSALERWERRTGPVLTVLAAAAVISLIVQAALDVQGWAGLTIDLVAWAAFAADYAIRIRLASDRWDFVRTHPLDLAAVALPALRSLRLLASIARVAALARRGRAERVIVTAALISVVIVFTGAALALDVERHAPRATITSYGDAIWWAVNTITAVGGSSANPVTVEGRFVASALMLVGIGALSTVTAALASILIRGRDRHQEQESAARLGRLEAEVARLAHLIERR